MFGMRILSPLFCVCLQGLVITQAQQILFVGPGGCDGEDPQCVPGTEGLDQLQVYQLGGTDGSLAHVGNVTVGEGAVWVATFEGCLFTTLVGTNQLVSFSMDGSELKKVSQVDSLGINPVHCAASSTQTPGTNILAAANYKGPDDGTDDTGAGVATFVFDDACTLTEGQFVRHHGHSVNPDRQGAAHPHSMVFDNRPMADGLLAFACDLGQDIVFSYHISDMGEMTELSRLAAPLGSGPRHTVMHPSQRILYVLHEMASSVGVCRISDDGQLSYVQSLSLLPDDFSGFSKAAEILISMTGDFVYATNRGLTVATTKSAGATLGRRCTGFGQGSDSVAVFSTGPDGLLTPLDTPRVPAQARFPRGMQMDGTGTFMVVAGQGSSSLTTFAIHPDGSLHSTGTNITGISNPVTIAFGPL